MDKETILKAAAQAAEQMQAAPQGPAVQPQPVPLAVQVGQGQLPDGSLAVVLIMQTPVGQNVFFLPAENAKAIAQAMEKMATMSGSGLVVPT